VTAIIGAIRPNPIERSSASDNSQEQPAMRVRSQLIWTFVSACVFLLGARLCAEDWPRWRGPRGNGTWHGPNLAETWPKDGLRQVWKVEIGGGYAGVTVAAGRVYALDRHAEPEEVERVLCCDAGSGERLWMHAYPVQYQNLDYGNGPRAAATVDGDRVYTVGALGHVHCFDVASGKVLWDCHLQDDFGGRLPMWGYAGSPLIIGELVILLPGGEKDASIVALDKRTGRPVWSSLSDEPGYATPVLIEVDAEQQLICWTAENVRAVDPATGRLLWSVPYKVTYGVAIATPVYHQGTLVVSGYWEGSKAIRPGRNGDQAEILWEENRYLRGLMSQALCRGDHVYLLDKQYGITCFDLKTGRKLWDDQNTATPRGRNPQASLVRLGDSDRVLVLNAEGELILAELTPDGYREHARAAIIGRTWAHPAYAGGRVYARSDEELVCVELPVAE
jgi:outer membrane protein assembly factor BamB